MEKSRTSTAHLAHPNSWFAAVIILRSHSLRAVPCRVGYGQSRRERASCHSRAFALGSWGERSRVHPSRLHSLADERAPRRREAGRRLALETV